MTSENEMSAALRALGDAAAQALTASTELQAAMRALTETVDA